MKDILEEKIPDVSEKVETGHVGFEATLHGETPIIILNEEELR